MKALKKLIPAVALMMVTLVLLGTSTYAWFSMNKTVTATGMTVTAKSNSTYLLISTDSSIVTDKTKGAATQSATTKNATLYPAAYNESTDSITPSTQSGTSTTIGAGHWYTANSTSSSDSTTNTTNVIDLGTSASPTSGYTLEENYYLENTFYLSLSKDSEAWTKYCKVTFSQQENSADTSTVKDKTVVSAVVVVTVGDSSTTFDFTSNSSSGYIDFTSTNLKNDSAIKVEVYTYINGEAENVNSAYYNTEGNKLTGTMELAFELVETNN